MGHMPVWIDYDGTVAQCLAQREEVFGTTAPYSIYIEDCLTDGGRSEQFGVRTSATSMSLAL
jgi:hypothetical protein